MNRFRIGRWIAEVLIVLGIAAITVSGTVCKNTPAREPLLYVSLGLLILALIIIFVLCRCENCGEPIFKNIIGAKRCPKCGRPLWPGQKPGAPAKAVHPNRSRSKKR